MEPTAHPTTQEHDICVSFLQRMEQLNAKGALLINTKTKQFTHKKSIQSTRYHHDGQRKIKKKIHNRLGHYPATHGLHLTLTIAGSDSTQTYYEGMSRQDAWDTIGYKVRYFLDRVNKLRKAKGWKKVKYRISVLEEQPGRLYPHYHIWFADLHYLAPIRDLQRLWPYGNIDLQTRWGTEPAEYIINYISKMKGRDFFLAMIWNYHLRLYATSRDYAYAPKKKTNTDWVFSSAMDTAAAKRLIDLHLNQGYSFNGPTPAHPRGS